MTLKTDRAADLAQIAKDTKDHVLISWSAQGAVSPLVVTGGEGCWIHSGDRRILAAAQATHYSNRTWQHILGRAGCEPRSIALVEGHDLKHLDAQRVLRCVARWQHRSPGAFLGPRAAGKHFVPSEMHREAKPDPLQGRPEPQVREALLGWLRVSGRARRYLAPPPDSRALAIWQAGKVPRDRRAEHLWATLATLDQQDTELYRHYALLTAVAWARDQGIGAEPEDRQQAEREIAAEHGVESFTDLQKALTPFPAFLAEVSRYRELLGLAKRVRAAWFERTAPPRPRLD